MDARISLLTARAGPHALTAINLDEEIKGQNGAPETLDIIFELFELTRFRVDTAAQLALVDEVLDQLGAERDCMFYSKVLRAWYIDRVPFDRIAQTIGYSTRRSIYTIKSRALRKFAILLYGIAAL